MLTFNTTLASTLAAAASKSDWCDALVTALGATRAIRCKRDSDAQAADVWTTGTEFINVALTGSMVVQGATITGFGVTGAFTTRLAADLASGASVLRIEGNGNWMQGTLGLPGSGADFILPSNPTTSTSVAFSTSMIVKPPMFLASGIGPAAPDVDADFPHTVELYDWSNPSSPTLVGSIVLDVRREDLTFQDAEIAGQMGDVRVTQSNSSITFGAFEFGATLLSLNASANLDAAVPLHQVLIACKPSATNTSWTTYPAMDTHNITTQTTFPQPFKIILKRQNGSVLHTFQMRDGLPINSPSCSQVRSSTEALRPHFNCGMMLPWQSHKPKVSANAATYFPGMVESSVRPSMCKNASSTNAAIPLLAGRSQINSLNQYFALPKWPLPSDNSYSTSDPNSDTFLYDVNTYYTGADGSANDNAVRTTGWDYEPGSISGHDWYTGPGGPRSDRWAMPTPLALFMTDQNGVRLKDGVTTYRQQCDAWGFAYFNHANHYTLNIKTFETLPNQQILNHEWSYSKAYYGSLTTYVSGGESRHIAQHAISNGSSAPAVLDYTGHQIWNGWAVDNLHSYCQPGWWALMFNSPMHLIAAKHRYIAHSLAQMAVGAPNVTSGFLERNGAWRWLHWTIMWKLASTHSFGIDRNSIERRFEQDMEVIHSTYVVPTLDSGHANYNNDDMVLLRAIGQRRSASPANDGAGSHSYTVLSSGLCFYMAHVWQLMKTTGCWTAMYNKSTKCQETMDFMMACMDRFCFDFILDTDGRQEAYTRIGSMVPTSQSAPKDFPTSWADWSANLYPKTGVEDWITNSDGTPRLERDVAQHLRAQYAFIRRDYFSEYPHARMTAACNKFQSYYDVMTSRVNAASGDRNKANTDWQYRFPPAGVIKAPA